MPISDILVSLLDPLIFLALSVSYLPRTIQRLLSTDGLLALSSWSTIQGAWFNSFWGDAGRRIREGNDARIVALLQGRVSGGQVVDDIASQPLGGTVVDVGPGVGFWVDVFATFNQIPGKMRVLGVEPSTGAHEELRRRVRETGLEGVYEVLPVGIESLSRVKPELEEGSVDCVVSVLCLCSIPQPDKAIRELYWLLKPGGRWYMYEHVRVKRSRFIETYQWMIGFIWPHLLGGCQLTRDTEASLRNAGPWTNFDLAQPIDEPWHHVIPHIYGILTK